MPDSVRNLAHWRTSTTQRGRRVRSNTEFPLLPLLPLLALAGCASPDRVEPTSVAHAWERQAQDATRQPGGVSGSSGGLGRSGATAANVGSERASPDPTEPPTLPAPDGPIATVNGRPIARQRLVELLVRSHGPGVLEQLIVHDAAARLVAERGLTVDRADIDREYDLALQQLVDPLGPITGGTIDREAGERLLDSVLSERNVSREEFRITLRRNAYLRKLVEAEQVFTEEQFRAEFDRRFGRRLLLRHIQLPTSGAVARLKERLAAGEDFADLARAHSVNLATAPKGGLLEPFSETDDQVPTSLRRQAALLRPGQVSAAVRVGSWYHILKLEQVLPAEEADYEAVRSQLERRLRDRLAEPAMRELYEKLFSGASIEIHDPALGEVFERRHPDRGR